MKNWWFSPIPRLLKFLFCQFLCDHHYLHHRKPLFGKLNQDLWAPICALPLLKLNIFENVPFKSNFKAATWKWRVDRLQRRNDFYHLTQQLLSNDAVFLENMRNNLSLILKNHPIKMVIARFLGFDESREWQNAMIKGRNCTIKGRGFVNQTYEDLSHIIQAYTP